jgi:hypothetical protein
MRRKTGKKNFFGGIISGDFRQPASGFFAVVAVERVHEKRCFINFSLFFSQSLFFWARHVLHFTCCSLRSENGKFLVYWLEIFSSVRATNIFHSHCELWDSTRRFVGVKTRTRCFAMAKKRKKNESQDYWTQFTFPSQHFHDFFHLISIFLFGKIEITFALVREENAEARFFPKLTCDWFWWWNGGKKAMHSNSKE